MTWRNSVRKRCGAVVLAVAVCGLAPAGSVWADEPVDPPPTTPADSEGRAPDEPVDGTTPETGQIDDTTVAVGAPPVPPASNAPEVAVGLPPVPPASDAPPEVAVGQPPVPPASDAPPEVAVGQPPVPPASAAPEVADDQPPVPPDALIATVSAALDLVAACL